MILRLLVDFYAWAWNVEAWRPSDPFDYYIVIMGTIFLDPIVVIAVYFGVCQIIEKIKGGAK